MAKTTGPLLSLGASGTVAGVMTFASWRGVPYVRQRVTPANPRSTAQVLTRDIFTNMGFRWKTAGPLVRAPWDRFATGQKLVGRNAFMGQNLAAMRGEADMDLFIGSPGAKGGLPPASLVLTTVASLGLEAVVTAPTPPTGWTVTSAIACCFIDQTPEAAVGDVIQEVEDISDPYSCDFTGLTAVSYQCAAWLKWAKPDGSVAYGASLIDQITVTA